jgi:peroxin-6
MLKAVTRQARLVDAKIRTINSQREQQQQQPISTAYFFDHFAMPEDVAVVVTEQDFLDAHAELVPSVSAGELAHYERVRAAFEGAKKQEGGTAARLGGLAEKRTVSGASGRSVGSSGGGKGKGKMPVGKGKGKAVALDSDGGYDHEDDDGDYESDNDGGGGLNGSVSTVFRDKGKGKEVAAAPFGDGLVGSGDESLYD